MPSVQQEEFPQIKATVSTEEELSWVEHQRKESQDTPRRLEDAAKFLSGFSSICLTIMLGPYNEVLKANRDSVTLKVGIICWLFSILSTLLVVFPFRYRYIRNSESSIREMNYKVVRIKFICLLIGTLLFLSAISIVACICMFSVAS